MNNRTEHTHGEPIRERTTIGFSPGSLWERLQSAVRRLKEPHQHEHAYQIEHFLPGKAILYIEHRQIARLTEENLAKELGDFLTKQDVERQWTSQFVPPKSESIITFPLKENREAVLSIVPLRLRNEKTDRKDLERLLITMGAELAHGPRVITANITLTAVAPDWLIGSLGHGPHPPSPGSWPVEAPAPSQAEQQLWLINDSQAAVPLPFVNNPGAAIDVAIIDTAPAKINLQEAYERWPSHPLLAGLLGPGGKLSVHADIQANLELMDYSVVGHRYLMPDHGLFIAGLIQSVAPDANLHLFKAFTPYGSASTETIAQSVLQILRMFRDPDDRANWRPLIVNCSFGLRLHGSSDLSDPIQGMGISLQQIFDQLTTEQDVIVVAAAGNSIERGASARQRADYPAAFQNVIGVGALPKDFPRANGMFQAASYSHEADNPPGSGFMTFGGEPGAGNGVLGAYTSEFPVYAPVYAEGCLWFLWRLLTGRSLNHWGGPGHLPPQPNTLTIDQIRYRPNNSGWAWWAGTSFAAPMISGILANWCSQPPSIRAMDRTHQNITPDNARRALSQWRQTSTTNRSEQVILMKQG